MDIQTNLYGQSITNSKDIMTEFVEAQTKFLNMQRLLITRMNNSSVHIEKVLATIVRIEEKVDLNSAKLIRLTEEKIK